MADFNPVGWFEIPVTDMDRATVFYEAVLGMKLQRQQLGPLEMAWFSSSKPDATGAMGSLVRHPDFYKPSQDGVLIYFTAPDIDATIARVEPAGGKVLMPKKQISPEHGFMAVVMDTEGNRIALHS
ncbi:VOC family protein [Patescibacteria group bacterium]|nr:MAG: VOC family protein [Patescibacteria group bacterium]